ncbi:hypothetical protein HRbin39_00843 [bacterium HR39]|nr:hypothetical protein HRbin39_00843 [bacterium HR39]
MFADGGPDGRPLHLAQANVHPRLQRHRPGEAPAVAVEHRQRPQVDGKVRHLPHEDVADGVQIRPAVMVDDALGIAGGARGVVEGDGLPFVGREVRDELGIPLGQQLLVGDLAEPLVRAGEGFVHVVHHQDPAAEASQRLADHRRVFGVGDQHLRLAVVQDEGDGARIEPHVQRVEHGAGHGHAEVGLELGRHVGQHGGHRVPRPHPAPLQGRGEPAAALAQLGVGEALRAVHHREVLGIDVGGALEEGERRERRPVGLVAVQIAHVGAVRREGADARTDERAAHGGTSSVGSRSGGDPSAGRDGTAATPGQGSGAASGADTSVSATTRLRPVRLAS